MYMIPSEGVRPFHIIPSEGVTLWPTVEWHNVWRVTSCMWRSTVAHDTE